MAGYLNLFNRFKYVGSTLRDRIPMMLRGRDVVPTPATWDLASFTHACAEVAANRSLDARSKALANRLLVQADEQGFPLSVLNEGVESIGRLDWRQRHAQTLMEVLHQVEQQWTQPTGRRRVVQNVVVGLANWVPPLALLASLVYLLGRYFEVFGQKADFHLFDLFLPAGILLIVLILMQVLIALLLPLRWPHIRSEFQRQLGQRLQAELADTYAAVPTQVAETLLAERRQVEKLEGETAEVAEWLTRREQAATIAGLYGK
jgi:hypothetical protein